MKGGVPDCHLALAFTSRFVLFAEDKLKFHDYSTSPAFSVTVFILQGKRPTNFDHASAVFLLRAMRNQF